MFVSTLRSSPSPAAPAAGRLRSERLEANGRGPDLPSAARLGHRFEALAAPGSAPSPRPLRLLPPQPTVLGRTGITDLAAPAATLAAHSPIQRMLSTDGLDTLPEGLHRSLAPKVRAFNRHLAGPPPKGNKRAHRDEQFRRLHEIDRLVNSHLKANPNTGKRSRQALFSLLRETEDHHVEATRRAVDAGDKLWLPSDVGKGDRRHAEKLWNSILKGQGNISITGNRAFKAETHSGIAKLLQGAHGRGLLGELNRRQVGPDRGIEIRRGDESVADPRDQNSYETLNTGAPNVGTGSTVHIAEREAPPTSLDEHQSGVHGEAIFDPRFITLGHELGHARHILGGTVPSEWEDYPPVQDPIEQGPWSKPEEHRNITGEENPLRAEHGLPARNYHATIGSGRSTRNRVELQGRLERLIDSVPKEHKGAFNGPLGGLYGELHHSDLSNRQVATRLRGRVDEAERNLPGQLRWQQAKSYGKKALPYLGAGLVGLGGIVAAKKYGYF